MAPDLLPVWPSLVQGREIPGLQYQDWPTHELAKNDQFTDLLRHERLDAYVL